MLSLTIKEAWQTGLNGYLKVTGDCQCLTRDHAWDIADNSDNTTHQRSEFRPAQLLPLRQLCSNSDLPESLLHPDLLQVT